MAAILPEKVRLRERRREGEKEGRQTDRLTRVQHSIERRKGEERRGRGATDVRLSVGCIAWLA